MDIVIQITEMMKHVKTMLTPPPPPPSPPPPTTTTTTTITTSTSRRGLIPSCLLMDLFQPENVLCNQWSGIVDWEMSEKLEASEIQIDWKSLEVVIACALMFLLEDCSKIQFLATIEKPRGGITGCNVTNTTSNTTSNTTGSGGSHSAVDSYTTTNSTTSTTSATTASSSLLPWITSPTIIVASKTNNLTGGIQSISAKSEKGSSLLPPSSSTTTTTSSSSSMKTGTLSLVMLLTRPCSTTTTTTATTTTSPTNNGKPTRTTTTTKSYLNQKLCEDTIFHSKTIIIKSILDSINGEGHVDMTEPGLQDHYLIKFSYEIPCQYRHQTAVNNDDSNSNGLLHVYNSMKQSNKSSSSRNISWKQDDNGQLNFAWTSAAIARFAVVSSTRASKVPCTFNMKSNHLIGLDDGGSSSHRGSGSGYGHHDHDDERKCSDATAISSDSSVEVSTTNSSKGKAKDQSSSSSSPQPPPLLQRSTNGGKSVSSLSQIVPAESVRMVAEKISSASPVGFIRKVFSSIFRSNQVLPTSLSTTSTTTNAVRPSQSNTTFTS
eukprot:scaffold1187_cov181-Ochromonas_danica.AAC.4